MVHVLDLDHTGLDECWTAGCLTVYLLLLQFFDPFYFLCLRLLVLSVSSVARERLPLLLLPLHSLPFSMHS